MLPVKISFKVSKIILKYPSLFTLLFAIKSTFLNILFPSFTNNFPNTSPFFIGSLISFKFVSKSYFLLNSDFYFKTIISSFGDIVTLSLVPLFIFISVMISFLVFTTSALYKLNP